MGRTDELGDHKAQEIVVYCRTGNRSGMAKQILNQIGYTNVRNVLGGISAWKQKF